MKSLNRARNRVTKQKEGNHWIINVNGRGMSLAFTEAEAQHKIDDYKRQLKIGFKSTKWGMIK